MPAGTYQGGLATTEGERLFEAGGLVLGRADDDPVRVHRTIVLPVHHDGGGGVDLDPLGLKVALEPAAAFQVQGDLAGTVLGGGRERALGAGADAAVGDQTVTGLETAHAGLEVRAIDIAHGRDAGAVGGGQVALGDQTLDDGGDTAVAAARFDVGAHAEGGPAAAVADQAAIADVARRQVGIADVGRSQALEPVEQAIGRQRVVSARRAGRRGSSASPTDPRPSRDGRGLRRGRGRRSGPRRWSSSRRRCDPRPGR